MKHEENLELLKLFNGLRVTDCRDGMDWIGYHHYGSVSNEFRPLFRASALGIAKTARYLPFEGPTPKTAPEEYMAYVGDYYSKIGTEPWAADLQPGDFVCLDLAGTIDIGVIGSANSLYHKKNGCVGYLLNGGVRDTDEVIDQEIPVWSKYISQNMIQGRGRCYEKDIPIAIGGVAIYPGDVVVADNDGVIVIPRKLAPNVAKWAREEAARDRIGRRGMFLELGIELDESVQDLK